MAGENGFDALLASMEEIDREAIAGVVTKYPDLKQGWLRQSDYSKNMDTVKKKSNEFDQAFERWKQWEDENVAHTTEDGRIVTKVELAWRTKASELEAKLSDKETNEVTFDELNKQLETKIADAGLIKKTDLESILGSKEEEISRNFEGYAKLLTKMPKLAMQHYKEFGEVLDTEDFFNKDVLEKKQYNLDQAYQNRVSQVRADKQKTEFEKQLADAKAQGAAEERRNLAMSNNGHMPTDSSGPNLGNPIQDRIASMMNGGEAPKLMNPREYAREWANNQ